jgi:5'-deoxynucleotidase YfbR-like HD superfamily hydrolase
MKKFTEDFSYSRAAQKLFELAIAKEFLLLGRAIQVVISSYAGMKRKNGQDEADHSISVAWSLWCRGVHDEEELVKALLHDLVESGKKSLDYIQKNFNDRIADDVFRLTKLDGEKGDLPDHILEEAFKFIAEYYHEMKKDWSYRRSLSSNRKKLLKMLTKKYKLAAGIYFNRLAESPICVVIKNVDKCDIFKNMSLSLPIRSQKVQILEYEAFLALRSKKVRKTKKDYQDLLFGCRNELETLIENAIYQISLRDKVEKFKKSIS